MTATTHILILDGHTPPTLNELMRGTLRRRMQLGRSWSNVVAVYAGLQNIPPATGKRRVTIRLTLGPGMRGADPDAYQKATGDALVNCGRLRGDAKEWVEWGPVGYTRGPVAGCAIVLEDIGE